MVSTATFLDRRRKSARRRVAFSTTSAVVLHALLAAAVFVGPSLFRSGPEIVEYVAVVPVVSAAALGLPQAPPPEPEPEPVAATTPPPPPEPEPEPPPADRPVIADPTATAPKKPRPSTRPSAPRPSPRRGTQTGSSSGTSTADVAGFDDPDFVYGYYLDRMVANIRAEWVRPVIGGDVSTVISFRIHEDGRVSGLRIARSSGYGAFDLAALRAVQAASPLPPLPRSYRKGSLGVDLIVR